MTKKSKSADWWTACNCPYTGCPNLSSPAKDRSSGCRSCWLEGSLNRFKAIHNYAHPGELQLHPNRLRKCLTTSKPQRYGWILGEPAEVCRAHPEYMAACVGVALARPEHGFGVPTSDPAGIVPWAKWLMKQRHWDVIQMAKKLLSPKLDDWLFGPRDAMFNPHHGIPQNWIWLISASTQDELNERAPHAAALESMGWKVGLHLEPLLSPVVVPYMMTEPFEPVWSWVVVGAAKGHTPKGGEIGWYHAIRNQCSDQRIPFWLKSPLTLDGREHRELPEGWPTT
jgi:hypothetical protein